jgi:hypothetical protein
MPLWCESSVRQVVNIDTSVFEEPTPQRRVA